MDPVLALALGLLQNDMRRISIQLILVLALLVVGIATGLAQWVWDWTGVLAQKALRDDLPREESVESDERLRRLQAINVTLNGRLAEYEQLQDNEGISFPLRVVGRAQVIQRSLRSGQRYLRCDKGGLEGVELGHLAMIGWSLIGEVVAVNAQSCLVRLITDGQARVPAVLYGVDGTRLAYGVMAGNGSHHECDLLYIDVEPGVELSPGMSVLSDAVEVADGRRYPSGLVLGAVSRCERVGDSNQWEIAIAPLRRLASVPSLLIVESEKRDQ